MASDGRRVRLADRKINVCAVTAARIVGGLMDG
jgi:hypothetical protein